MFNPRFLFIILLGFIYSEKALIAQSSSGNTSSVPFSFSLPSSARTSAGVFKKDGTLIKTLWGGVNYSTGTHNAVWDGTDDDGSLVMGDNYDIRVLSNNVNYTWEGVVGNSSTQFTGSSIHRSFFRMANIAIAGTNAFYTTEYNERAPSQFKFNTSTPNECSAVTPLRHGGQSTEHLATDGTNVYWAGNREGSLSWIFATKVSDNSEVSFTSGISYQSYNAIDVFNGFVTGLAVQKSGNYLFVSYRDLNIIHVINKTTGALIQTISINAPRQLAVDVNDNLWVTSGSNLILKQSVNANGTLSSTGISISGLNQIGAIAVSPDNSTIIVADAGASQQLKAFSNLNGSPSWTFGKLGGYATDPTVTNDKFSFDNTSIAFQPDGSFWVIDRYNDRMQHYSSNRVFIDRIMYLPHSYNCFVDLNNPSRVFSDNLEFYVDYSKPLAPNNGSWTLVKNYSQSISSGEAINNVVTLGNGRTYGCLTVSSRRMYKVVEFMLNAPLRETGIEFSSDASTQWYSDGSLRTLYSFDNQPLVWYKKSLIGFDGSNNPIWADKLPLASIPSVGKDDPKYRGIGGTLKAGEQTSSGLMVIYDGSLPSNGGSLKYHLGAVKVGDNKWLWRTAKATFKDYRGPFPTDGSYDIGNGVVYAGSVGMVIDRSVYYGYHGEFWKNGQCNMWNQVYDDGLMVGQFGSTDPSDAAPGMAGNAFAATMVKDANGNVYLYHNDESYHAGVHRWKITGLNTIQEQTIPIVYAPKKGGLLGEYFDGSDLNNLNLKSSRVDSNVNFNGVPSDISSQSNYSTRWLGFVQPIYSQSYSFFVSSTKGIKLWINDSLIINNWGNNKLSEMSGLPYVSGQPFVFEAGKRYMIRMEINGAGAALSWSSASQAKQVIPSSNLYPYDQDRSPADGVDLMEGLPFCTSLENNTYGWKRNGIYEETNLYANSFWNVNTNKDKYNIHKSPDIYINYLQSNPSAVNTITRDLGTNTSLTSWKLSGEISLESCFPDGLGGGTYLEVLDANDKIIARFNHTIEFNEPQGNPITVRGNNQGIFTENGSTVVYTIWKQQPVEISAANGKITFKYGNFSPITTDLLDPTSNWMAPKTMRVYIFGNNYERKIDLGSMRFFTNTSILQNTTPSAPTLAANDSTNVLSASHTLGVSEILVGENNAAYKAYTRQIIVGNVSRPAGYWKFKIKSATGRNESPVVESPAFTTSNNTPSAPVLDSDDNTNILSASHALGISEIVVSENDAAFAPYAGQISVGNVVRTAGNWKFKIKSATGRSESVVVESPAFTISNSTPVAPTLNADDITNVLIATHILGASEILVSENNSAFVSYAGTIYVGDVARPAGYWKFKIKSASGRNESAIVQSPAFTQSLISNSTPPVVTITSPSINSNLSASTPITITAASSDADGSVVKVQFYCGSTKVGEDLTSPYSYTSPGMTAGTYSLTARAIDNDGLVDTSDKVQIIVSDPVTGTCPGTGSIDWQYWKMQNPDLSLIPVSTVPTGTKVLTSFASPINFDDSYGSRALGYVCPPKSGNYVFYIAGDDAAELWLSTDATSSAKKMIASVGSYTNVGEYTRYLSQQSKPVYLQAGQLYYIEALQAEAVGGDHVSVAWKLPDGTLEAPIAGSHLVPFSANITNTTPSAPVLSADDNTNVLIASHILGSLEILVSENGAAFAAYTGQILVGNVSRAAGYWKFKTKSAAGRNESSVALSPAFTITNTTPVSPTLVADDATNVLSASHILGSSEILVSENSAAFVSYAGQISVSNVTRAAGYWKFKIKSATGRNESSLALSPAFTITNTTPSAPVLAADDATNVLSASHTLGISEILVSENGGAFVSYTGQISVGNVTRAAGYWKFKIKSATGRNESSLALSPAFTITNTTPSAPVLAADDATNVLSASHTLGISEILVSENGGAFVSYTGQISVGNVVRAAGYWQFKIKSATGRSESAVALSPAFTITNATPSAPVLAADDATNILSASHTLGISEILVSENGGAFISYTGQISVGNVTRAAGYWQFKIKSATGRNESAVTSSPAFTITNTTPSAPVLEADDATNILSASHTLGTSEILVSGNGGAFVSYTGQISVGNVTRAAGYWQFKIKSATGRNESAITLSPAFTLTNSTPSAPVLLADDVTNILSASHTLGTSEILVSENGGAFTTYTGQISTGNVSRAAGYWQFKIKATSGRNESLIAQSPAFTIVGSTPAAPVLVADDVSNILSASHSLGIAAIIVSVNNAAYVPYTAQIAVGNVVRPAGYWKFKTKATSGRNESPVVESPAFTVTNTTPTAPVLMADNINNLLLASHVLGATEILFSTNNGAYATYTGQIKVGNVARPTGYWKFKIRAATGRNESLVVLSPAFTAVSNAAPLVNITSPANNSAAKTTDIVTITANSSDSDGSISKVEFFNGSTKIGEDLTSPYTITASISKAGLYKVLAIATDNSGAVASDSVSLNITDASANSCAGAGSIVWQYWKMSGGGISSIPYTTPPTGSNVLTSFASPVSIGDSYGSRAVGYICPPVSGNYVFLFASDDEGELWLSSDETPASKQRIAFVNAYTNPGEYTRYSSQMSKKIYLEAGQKYYVEALQIEGVGSDHMSVAWQLPDGSFEQPIAGSHLIPITQSAPMARNAVTTKKAGEHILKAGEDLGLSAYPNPFVTQTSVACSISQPGDYTVQIYSMQGLLLKTIFTGKMKAGVTKIHFDGSALPHANYVCRIISQNQMLYKQIMITR